MAGERFVVWGSAGHAKVVASLLGLRGASIIALFDNDPSARSALPDVPLYIGLEGLDRWAKESAERKPSVYAAIAIGGSRGRDRLSLKALLEVRGLMAPTLVHPDASVCATAVLGAGTQILAGAVVAADARIGEACIVNHRASVDHECVIGHGVHMAPGATLCGCVTVSDGAMVGAGAVILPRLTIGADAIIGAGAVVTRNIPPGSVVTGNPGRVRQA
jgi:sugar O-acyltransferase (sialic acid O-acetyltransferase NeuD family)